jgi:hypothetical protein
LRRSVRDSVILIINCEVRHLMHFALKAKVIVEHG